MPAAAVIPAPLAYIKVVAVKKLVVEFLAGLWAAGPSRAAITPVSSLVSFAVEARCFVT